MTKIIKMCALLGFMLMSSSVFAGDIQVDSAWSRATAPGQDVAMVDFAITSKNEATLVGASSAICKTAEIHSMSHENGMMKMRQVQSVALPAGKRVVLGAGGYHIMLLGLASPLKAGAAVPLTLNVKAGKDITKVDVTVQVKALTEASPQREEPMHHMHH